MIHVRNKSYFINEINNHNNPAGESYLLGSAINGGFSRIINPRRFESGNWVPAFMFGNLATDYVTFPSITDEGYRKRAFLTLFTRECTRYNYNLHYCLSKKDISYLTGKGLLATREAIPIIMVFVKAVKNENNEWTATDAKVVLNKEAFTADTEWGATIKKTLLAEFLNGGYKVEIEDLSNYKIFDSPTPPRSFAELNENAIQIILNHLEDEV